MSNLKKLQRQLRQQELLKNFSGDYYQEKQIGNQWFVKNFNRGTGKWQVAVYSKESFAKYKAYNINTKLDDELNLAIEND